MNHEIEVTLLVLLITATVELGHVPTTKKIVSMKEINHCGREMLIKNKGYIVSTIRKNYVLLTIPRHLRIALGKLRFGNHDLIDKDTKWQTHKGFCG